MIFEEKKISSQRIYEGAILNVRRDKVTAYGGEAYREIIEHNGAVAMVPITEEGNIIMVEQFRYACGRAVLEIPAGKIDAGETDPAAVAARELREETGIASSYFKELRRVVNEQRHFVCVVYFCLTDCDKNSVTLQEGETIDYKWVTKEEILKMPSDTLASVRVLEIFNKMKL